MQVRLFVPNGNALEYLWKRFDEGRAQFPDELPEDPIRFTCWIAAEDSACFTLHADGDDEPLGIVVFTEINPGRSATGHIFIWDPEKTTPADLVHYCRACCVGIMRQFNLVRINGLTPCTHPHAKVFAERVGFKVEGRLRNAARVRGRLVDAWIEGLLPGDVDPAEGLISTDTITEEGSQ